MILFISNSGESLPLAYRLKRQGVEVGFYIHNPVYRRNYDGMVNKVKLPGLRKTVMRADIVIFDITRPNEKTKQDLALLKVFKLKRTVPEVFGAVADRIKQVYKKKVIGASAETATWELDRKKGLDIAKKIGFQIPEFRTFKNLQQGIRFLAERKDLWVLKPFDNQDLDLTYVEKYPGELRVKMIEELPLRLRSNNLNFMLQKKVDGTEISTEGWFDGDTFTHFNHTFEDKRFMNGNLGPAIGSQNNTVWISRTPGTPIVRVVARMAPLLRAAGYIGPLDANVIVGGNGTLYFLEWTPRFGYDAIYNLVALIDNNIDNFLLKDFKTDFKDGFASSIRLTIPPFPYSTPRLLIEYAREVPIEESPDIKNVYWEDVYMTENGLRCAGADGILGVVASHGNSIGGSVGNTYRTADKLKIGAYKQYRTDLGKRAERDYKQLSKRGIV